MEDFKKFIIDNDIVVTIAGFSIALFTKDLILSFSGDIVIPTITTFLLKLNINFLTDILPNKSIFNLKTFFQNLISWILGVVITYIFIQYTFKKILGIGDDQNMINKNQNLNTNNTY
jgi:large-conductance mechanosensitive channel